MLNLKIKKKNMSEKNSFRLSKLVREFNVKIDRILDFLSEKGVSGLNPN